MRIRRLRLVNYRRYEDATIEFPDGVTAVIGRNGSGKSTILEAIGFALFGTRATRTNRELIRLDDAPPGDSVRVELDFELAGQTIEIVRELRGKAQTPSAAVAMDGVAVVAPGASSNEPATKHIEALLGMDREAFFTTVVAQQKQLALLADKDATSRKRLILGMLGVDAIDRAIASARVHRRDVLARLEAHREQQVDLQKLAEDDKANAAARAANASNLEVLAAKQEEAAATAAAAQSALESAKEQAAHVQALEREEQQLKARTVALHTQIEELGKEIRAAREAETAAKQPAVDTEPLQRELVAAEAHASRVAEHEAAKARQARVAARRAELTRELAAPVPADPGLAAIAGREPALRQAVRAGHESLAELATKLGHVAQHVATLTEKGDAPCPTCLRPLGEHRGTLEADLQRQQTKLAKEQDVAKEALATAEAELQAWETTLADARRADQQRQQQRATRKGLQEELQRLEDVALPAAPGPTPDVKALRQKLQAAREQEAIRIQAEARAASLPKLVERHDAVATEAASIASELAAVASRHAALPRLDVGTLARARDAAATAATAIRDEHANAQQDRARLEAEQNHLKERRAQAEKQGKAVAALEKESRLWTALVGARGGGLLDDFKSHIIARIAPAIRLEASRLLRLFTHGRYEELYLDDDYNVYVTDGGVAYTLDRFSGGEQDLAHLALRLAVSRLLAERAGAEVRFLALDEVAGSLDGERRDAVLSGLQGLGGLYTQILVITHQEELRDALDQTLEVQEDQGRAVVRLHNG